MSEVAIWLVIAGIPFALIMVALVTGLIERHRIRTRRTHLRSRLVR